MAAESFFSYSITRPYPYRWFTPTVVIGGLLAAVLFSFLNLASSGYDLIDHKTANPNETISDSSVWFEKLPAYLTSKVQPHCQPLDFRVNSQLFTNQTALTYTLTGVSLGTTIVPSLTYFNNPITNCNVTSIEIDLNALDRTGTQIGFAEWGATVRASLACTVDIDAGPMSINLTTLYDYVPSTLALSQLPNFLGTDFLTRDKETKASLYWGESLMSMYYVYLTRTMQDIRVNSTENGETGIKLGTIAFRPNPNGSSASTDISNLGFFEVDYRLIRDHGGGDFDTIYPGLYENPNNIAALDGQDAYPNVWIIADSLAKSVYSTVLIDLGQVSAAPNILTDPIALQYFTSNFSLALEHKANAQPGPAQQDYSTLKATTGPLGTTSSVFSASYDCQIPQLRSPGTLFVNVLIADLVFLQVLWKLFVLATNWWLVRRQPSANRCLGCSDDQRGHYAAAEQYNTDLKGARHNVMELTPMHSATASEFLDTPIRRKTLNSPTSPMTNSHSRSGSQQYTQISHTQYVE